MAHPLDGLNYKTISSYETIFLTINETASPQTIGWSCYEPTYAKMLCDAMLCSCSNKKLLQQLAALLSTRRMKKQH